MREEEEREDRQTVNWIDKRGRPAGGGGGGVRD